MRIVPALDRGLRILDLLADRREPMRVSEIASLLDIPRSAAYELIHTLLQHQAVQQHENGDIGLGPKLLMLGTVYGQSLDFSRVAQEIARDVMMECDETVQVGVLEGRHVLYVAKADSRRLVRLVSTVGARLPAHCTALGKVLLALLPREELQARLQGITLERMTEQSLGDMKALLEQLDTVREQGYASEQSESNEDVGCVAAPVWDEAGRNVAAISISVPLSRLDGARREMLRDAVMRGAERFSTRLGHGVRPAVPGAAIDQLVQER
jgi:DNA-binding IclR family transcriptional regulator